MMLVMLMSGQWSNQSTYNRVVVRLKPLHPVLCFVGFAKFHDNLYSHHGISLLTACQIFAICPCVR